MIASQKTDKQRDTQTVQQNEKHTDTKKTNRKIDSFTGKKIDK